MARLRRLLLPTLSALSLLLALTSLVLWPVSHYTAHVLAYEVRRGTPVEGTSREYFLLSNLGTLYFARNIERFTFAADPNPFEAGSHFRLTSHDPSPPMDRPAPGPLNLGPFGVGTLSHQSSFNGNQRSVRHDALRLPHWSAAILLGLPPLLHLRRALRTRRRRAENQCLACGYDLRASPERCPECGLQDPRATPSAAR